jgi:hypothetical protein
MVESHFSCRVYNEGLESDLNSFFVGPFFKNQQHNEAHYSCDELGQAILNGRARPGWTVRGATHPANDVGAGPIQIFLFFLSVFFSIFFSNFNFLETGYF